MTFEYTNGVYHAVQPAVSGASWQEVGVLVICALFCFMLIGFLTGVFRFVPRSQSKSLL